MNHKLSRLIKPKLFQTIALLGSFFLIFSAYSSNNWEANISAGSLGSSKMDNSQNTYSVRLAATDFVFNYKNYLDLGVDTSIAHLRTTKANTKHKAKFSNSITIISPAILARLYPTSPIIIDKSNFTYILPFLTIGVGPSYMTNNSFEGRKLGKNFVFQDIGGIGFKTNYFQQNKPNKQNELSFGLYIAHYSNANFYKHNRGITVPISASLGYRF
jgi:hypothetical protein